jgi:hypothetical protein
LRFQQSKSKGKTLENFFEKKFSKPFKKLLPETALRFQKKLLASLYQGISMFCPLQTRAKRGFVYAVERACGL